MTSQGHRTTYTIQAATGSVTRSRGRETYTVC